MWRAAGYSSGNVCDTYNNDGNVVAAGSENYNSNKNNNGGNFYDGYHKERLYGSCKDRYQGQGQGQRHQDIDMRHQREIDAHQSRSTQRHDSNQHHDSSDNNDYHNDNYQHTYNKCGNNRVSNKKSNNLNCGNGNNNGNNNKNGAPITVVGNNNVITNVYGNINKKSTRSGGGGKSRSGRDLRDHTQDYSRTRSKTRGTHASSYVTHSSLAAQPHSRSSNKHRHHVRTKNTTHWRRGEVDVVVPAEQWVEEPAVRLREEVHMEVHSRDVVRPRETWHRHDVPGREVYERQREDVPVMVVRTVEEPTTVLTKVHGYDVVSMPTKTKRMQVNEVEDTTVRTHSHSYDTQHGRKTKQRHVRHTHHSRHTHHHRRP